MSEPVKTAAFCWAFLILVFTSLAWLNVPHGDLPTNQDLTTMALIGIGFAILAVRR